MMVTVRSAARLALGLLFACSAAAAPSAAAAAEGPRWDLVATANPTSPQPGSPQDEVQEVVVNATGGTFRLSTPGIRECTKAETAALPFNAPAAEVQSALETACAHLEGKVTVTVGAGGAGTYAVTFTGEQFNDRPVALLGADGSSLTGGAATATVKEVARGHFTPLLEVAATNVGGASTNETSTITIEDALPAGAEVTASSIVGYDAYRSSLADDGEGGAPLTCTAPPTLRCTFVGKVDPGDVLIVTIRLIVAPGAAPGNYTNTATVTGGGAPEASVSDSLPIGDANVGFGPTPGSVIVAPSTNQAGAHANLTTAFTFNTVEANEVAAYPKDIRFDLPPGLVGDVVGLPRCPIARVVEQAKNPNSCPPDTMVGMAVFTVTEGAAREISQTTVSPVYNIAPAKGEPAAFAFNAIVFPVRFDTSVLSNGNYAVRVSAAGLPQEAQTLSSSVTIWGVPADHNGPGEDKSIFNLIGGGSFGGPNPAQTRMALLTNPQQCTEPLSASMSADSWATPGVFVSSGPVPVGTLGGCDQLSLQPAFTMLPDTLGAGVPAGYSFDLQVPQREEPDGLATPNVKNVKLTLPAGVVVSPSAASGLATCSNAQFFGPDRGTQEPAEPAHCPNGALIGTVEVRTPTLALPLQGQVYLGEPECDPCTPEDARAGKMVRLFMEVGGEGESPIVVKLAGSGTIDQTTGQITTLFANNPQLPFNELKVTLAGGPRATLANPRTCGSLESALDVTPWSSPLTPDVQLTSAFDVNQNCFGAQFAPTFTAGAANAQAGAYSPLTVAFARQNSDEYLSTAQFKMPPGLLGKLSSVPLCGEPQASEGTCSPESEIGHVQALVGPGSTPYAVEGGKAFLTTGYKGAPFGLSFAVPAKAGPYTFAGNTGHGVEVVRAAVSIDPSTSQITVTSDPLPGMLDGIPLQIRAVNVTIDREHFMFNPTNCAGQTIAGTIGSEQGAEASVSIRFEAANCAALRFRPSLTASTSAKTSRRNGASLHVLLTYPKTPQSTQANIKSVHVELPKVLPSRASTLNRACPDSVFNQNPANCPSESRVGYARSTTPVLPVPLEGPAYFVSHGGARFPELIVVLQGYGVTIDLRGETFINKAGITSSTFNSVPDVPVSSFELTLPQGRFSALAANTNLCAASLVMPTKFTGQNGAVLEQMTKIAVTGCKPALRVVRRKVKGSRVTLTIHTPMAGRLTAKGAGLKSVHRSVRKAGNVTITLTLTKAERALLRRHHGRRLRAKIRLSLIAKHGQRITGSVSVLVG